MGISERESERIEFLGADDAANTLLDLSTTGAGFLYPAEKSAGSMISVKIREHRLAAVVVHCQKKDAGYRIGLKFKNVPPEIYASLEQLVEEFSRGVPLTCEIIENG